MAQRNFLDNIISSAQRAFSNIGNSFVKNVIRPSENFVSNSTRNFSQPRIPTFKAPNFNNFVNDQVTKLRNTPISESLPFVGNSFRIINQANPEGLRIKNPMM